MTFCHGGTGSRRPLQLHTSVEQPLTTLSRGRITCDVVGQDPIRYEWTDPDGRCMTVPPPGHEAHDLSVGTYHVVAVDGTDARADAYVQVRPSLPHAVVVTGYVASPASSGVARDGAVEAHGHGMAACNRFLWSNGVVTPTPRLVDVGCGSYSVLPISYGDDPHLVPVVVHTCAPLASACRPSAGES